MVISRLAVGPLGDFAAFFRPGTALGRSKGTWWRSGVSPPRAAQVSVGGVVTLDGAGRVRKSGPDGSVALWSLPQPPPAAAVCAVSSDGRLVFDGRAVCWKTGSQAPHEVDFHEQWTFAEFAPNGALALAFESSQPWSEHGSYGSPTHGFKVVDLADVLASESETRSSDEHRDVRDVAWHPSGTLAWLAPEGLWAQVQPRNDSDVRLPAVEAALGDGRALAIDETGRFVAAAGGDELVVVDLSTQRVSRRQVDAVLAFTLARGTLALLDARQRREDLSLDALSWEPWA